MFVLFEKMVKSIVKKVDFDKLKENFDKEIFLKELKVDIDLNDKLNIMVILMIYVNDKLIKNFFDYKEILKMIKKELKNEK